MTTAQGRTRLFGDEKGFDRLKQIAGPKTFPLHLLHHRSNQLGIVHVPNDAKPRKQSDETKTRQDSRQKVSMITFQGIGVGGAIELAHAVQVCRSAGARIVKQKRLPWTNTFQVHGVGCNKRRIEAAVSAAGFSLAVYD